MTQTTETYLLRVLYTPGLKGRSLAQHRVAAREAIPNDAEYREALASLAQIGLVRVSRTRVVPTEVGRSYIRALRA